MPKQGRPKKLTDEQTEALRQTHSRSLTLVEMADEIKDAFMELIRQGNDRAILQGQKQVYDAEKFFCQEFEDKVTCWIIKLADSSRQVHAILADLFGYARSTAENNYKRCVQQYQLETPHEKQKRLKAERKEHIRERFRDGNLSEVDLLKFQMEEMLEQQAMAEFASEKVQTSKQMLDITRRLDEIQEREERAKRMSSFDIQTRLDAIVFGTAPEQIEELKAVLHEPKQVEE